MVHITQLDEEKLRRGQSGGKSGGKSGGGIPNLIDVYQKGLECFVKISAVDGVSRKAKVQASLTSHTSLTSLTSLTLACRPHGPSPHVYPYITGYGFSERHVSYPHLFPPFVSPICFTHFFHPFLSPISFTHFFHKLPHPHFFNPSLDRFPPLVSSERQEALTRIFPICPQPILSD